MTSALYACHITISISLFFRFLFYQHLRAYVAVWSAKVCSASVCICSTKKQYWPSTPAIFWPDHKMIIVLGFKPYALLNPSWLNLSIPSYPDIAQCIKVVRRMSPSVSISLYQDACSDSWPSPPHIFVRLLWHHIPPSDFYSHALVSRTPLKYSI